MNSATARVRTAQADGRSEPPGVRRVMIVESDDDSRPLIAALFEAHGYDVNACRGSHEGRLLLREGVRPNVILVDALIPDLSEWQLRITQTSSATLVVALSPDSPEQAVALDADLFLVTKPLELEKLFETVDNLITAREQKRQREQAAELLLRLTALGELAGSIAHEVNNPLAFVIGKLELTSEPLRMLEVDLAGKASPAFERVSHLLGDAQRAADRIAAVMRGVLLFAATDTSSVGPVDVHATLEASLQVASNAILACAQLERRLEPVPSVRGNPARLGLVFLNILLDAVHAIRAAGGVDHRIAISTFVNSSGDPVVTVSNTGRGLESARTARIFEPLFSIKEGGLGLGAAVSHDILDAMAGTMEIVSEPGQDACVRVTLPRDGRVPVPSLGLSRTLGAAVVRRRARVLVVDDEPMMLEMVCSMLEQEYDVATFSDPRAALASMLAGSFDVILCDLMMPELTGMDLYERVCVERPELAKKFIFISGGAFTDGARPFIAGETRPLLSKPFHMVELLDLIEVQLGLELPADS